MNSLEIIRKYYPADGQAYAILTVHSRLVADKCLAIAKNKPVLNIDEAFIEEAAMLHDIGVFMTNAPDIGCYGNYPYISHGYLGADILRSEGLPKHALVAERHTGTGITKEAIQANNLPLPQRNFIPVSIEEQLICFADKFYSKTHLTKEKTVKEVRASLAKFGDDSVTKFDRWCEVFL